jgi:hypothetical protein
MPRAISPIRLLALASALVCVSSCNDKPNSAGSLAPPANLLAHQSEPEMTADALASEEAYERQRDAKIEWGRENASIMDRACWWFQDAGVKALACPKRGQ